MTIRFTCFECASRATFESFTSAAGRDIAGVLNDVYFHALELAVVAFLARGHLPRVEVREVLAGRFERDGVRASGWTAARVEAHIIVEHEPYSFTSRIMKDAPRGCGEKGLEFPGAGLLSLDGGKWEPHYCVFEGLLDQPPRVRVSLEHHALVAALCARVDEEATDMGCYPFDQEVPAWL